VIKINQLCPICNKQTFINDPLNNIYKCNICNVYFTKENNNKDNSETEKIKIDTLKEKFLLKEISEHRIGFIIGKEFNLKQISEDIFIVISKYFDENKTLRKSFEIIQNINVSKKIKQNNVYFFILNDSIEIRPRTNFCSNDITNRTILHYLNHHLKEKNSYAFFLIHNINNIEKDKLNFMWF